MVVESSYAEFDAATLRPLYFDLPLRERLVAPAAPGDLFCRVAWALRYLLPAFNAAVAQVAGWVAGVVQFGIALYVPPG